MKKLLLSALLVLFLCTGVFARNKYTQLNKLRLKDTGSADITALTLRDDEDTGLFWDGSDGLYISAGGVTVNSFSKAGATIPTYLVYTSATAETSATTDATIIPTATDMVVDTWTDLAVSTVNMMATYNAVTGTEFANGTIVTLMSSLASQDIVINTDGNFILKSAFTLDEPYDSILCKYNSTVSSWNVMNTYDAK